MNIIYNLGISLYSLGVRIASVRNKKARLMREGQAQTFGILDRQVEKGREICMDSRVVARRVRTRTAAH